MGWGRGRAAGRGAVEGWENGPSHGRVRLTVEVAEPAEHPLADCFGIVPDEDVKEMLRIIEEEFGRMNPDAWR